MVRAYYYTAIIEDQEYSPIRPLVDWLYYNGYTMVTKPTKEYTDSSGRRKVKGNMDVELAVDVMEMSQRFDHIVLFSGHGDFFSLIDAIQREGVRASVVSTVRSKPPMVSDELRRKADNFIELYDLVDDIAGDQPQRPSHTFGAELSDSSPYQEPTKEDANRNYDYLNEEDETDFTEMKESGSSSNGGPR